MRYLARCSPESKLSLYLTPRDAGFARVSAVLEFAAQGAEPPGTRP
jgi:hypothetical protein